MIRTRIAGLGHYLPERVVTNFELEKLVATSDQWIRDRTGIVERHVAAPHETSSSLALNAARMALEDARMNPEDIELDSRRHDDARRAVPGDGFARAGRPGRGERGRLST